MNCNTRLLIIIVFVAFMILLQSDEAVAKITDTQKSEIISLYGEDLDTVPFEIKQAYRLEKEMAWKSATIEEKLEWIDKWQNTKETKTNDVEFFNNVSEERLQKLEKRKEELEQKKEKILKEREKRKKELLREKKREEKEQAKRDKEREKRIKNQKDKLDKLREIQEKKNRNR